MLFYCFFSLAIFIGYWLYLQGTNISLIHITCQYLTNEPVVINKYHVVFSTCSILYCTSSVLPLRSEISCYIRDGTNFTMFLYSILLQIVTCSTRVDVFCFSLVTWEEKEELEARPSQSNLLQLSDSVLLFVVLVDSKSWIFLQTITHTWSHFLKDLSSLVCRDMHYWSSLPIKLR